MAKWNDPKTDYKVGSPVTAKIFNELAENEIYLNETKITTHNVQDAIITSEQNNIRQNLTEQDTIMGAFGKIRKWFADLKMLAFKDKVDNADIIDVNADKVKGLHNVSVSGNYEDLLNKPAITKAAVGLDNVANERQYSANNVPPYPVTSVNGMTGAITLPPVEVTPNGTYPNMTVGNSQALGGVDSSQFVKIDSPLISGVKISVMKLNKSLSCTATADKIYAITGEISEDIFDPSRDVFYFTAFSGKGTNFWADMSSCLSYRNGVNALTAYLNNCNHTKGNALVDMHSSKVYFKEDLKMFYCQVSPSYRFYTGTSYMAGQDRDDNLIIVDLYLIRFK